MNMPSDMEMTDSESSSDNCLLHIDSSTTSLKLLAGLNECGIRAKSISGMTAFVLAGALGHLEYWRRIQEERKKALALRYAVVSADDYQNGS